MNKLVYMPRDAVPGVSSNKKKSERAAKREREEGREIDAAQIAPCASS